MNEELVKKLREGTGLPVLRKIMFDAADVIENQDETIRTLLSSCSYINVQERQPDPEERVLCWTKNGRCQVGTIGYINNDDGPSYYCDYGAGVWLDVVCWKPILPPDMGEAADECVR